MFILRKVFLVAATATTLVGCATVPQSVEPINTQQEVDRTTGGWEAVPAIRKVSVGNSSIIMSSVPIPADVKAKKIAIGGPMQVFVADLVAMINMAGVPAMLDLGDKDFPQKKVFVPDYKGTLGDFTHAVEQAADMAFEWRNGVLVVSPGLRYAISVPQNEALIKRVEEEIKAMGALDVVASHGSAMISFKAPPSKAALIEQNIDRTIRNAAMVGLQVAVITVSLDRAEKTGIDWGKLQMTFGSLVDPTGVLLDPFKDVLNPVKEAAKGAASAVSGSPVATATQVVNGAAARLEGQSLMFGVREGHFSLNGLINALSSYGDTRATQNLILRTMSGSPVKIRSGESVPYISGVSVSTTGNTQGAAGLLGAAEVETAETGITLEIKPSFDAQMGVVGMDIQIELASNMGFVTLSAGAQVGSLTQPQIQQQSFNNIARVMAGETVVLGGLVYDSVSDNRETLAGLEKAPIGSKDSKVRKNALLIVVRPSITAFQFGD